VEQSPGPQPTLPLSSSPGEEICTNRDAPEAFTERVEWPAENVPAAANSPDLHVERIAPARGENDNTLTYGMFCHLTGSKPFIDVLVEHRVPAGVRYLGSDPPARVRGDKLSWHLGRKEPGTKLFLQVLVEMPLGGKMSWDGQADFQIFYCHKIVHQIRVLKPRLALAVKGPESVLIGGDTRLHLDVRNDGNWPATGVGVVVELPEGLQFAQGRRVMESTLGSLAAGEAAKLVLTAKAIQPGHWEAKVLVSGDDDVKATTQTAVTVIAPALELRLGARPRFVVGEEINYRIELSNPGTAPATRVRLADSLPEALEFLSASSGGTYDPARREVAWVVGSLAPGRSQFYSVKLKGEAPGDFLHEVTARADGDLAVTAQGEISYEISDEGGSDILEKFVALLEGEGEAARGPEDLIAPLTDRRLSAGNEDKYIVFTLAGTEYAVAMSSVLEVAPPVNITPLPNVPDWMIGVTNMRGDVVSIVDLRVFLGLERSAQGQARRMLVVRTSQEDMVTGLIVDRVRGICRLPPEQFTTPTSSFEDPVAPYLRGVSEHKGGLLVLLDADRLLLSAEMRQFEPV
jgi:purine-binding chemotaxis protein CheW